MPCSRAEKIFIFEMGTAEERSWAASLPAISEGQERFVASLLDRCGLTRIRAIATTGAYQKGADRLLFAAEPKERAALAKAQSRARAPL